jgi:hypothetical protein
MTRANLRHNAHGAQKKAQLGFSARRKGTASRDRWGETSLKRLRQDRFLRNSELSGIFNAEMLALATTCRNDYTMPSISLRHFEASIVLMS